jgi:hypothetical protein
MLRRGATLTMTAEVTVPHTPVAALLLGPPGSGLAGAGTGLAVRTLGKWEGIECSSSH